MGKTINTEQEAVSSCLVQRGKNSGTGAAYKSFRLAKRIYMRLTLGHHLENISEQKEERVREQVLASSAMRYISLDGRLYIMAFANMR